MQWKLDIAQLKKGMQDARREISLANAEFKNATAGMGKWSDSADGVEAKTKQLTKVLDGQTTILEELKKQYAITAQEMGETSPEAQKLKIQIENQEAACKKTQSQLDQYNDRLAELQAEQQEAQSPISKLNSTIDEQEQAVADLKRQYANAIVGNNPAEAKRLATEIDSLSSELAENKQRMSDAERAADELDKSIDSAGDSARDASEGGFTVMKGALADLVSAGIQKAIDGVRQLGEMVIEAGKQAVSSYSDYEQLVGGVETLFGTGGVYSIEKYAESVGKSVDEAEGDFFKLIDAQNAVLKNSRNAFKTAGMSQNEYMETVTAFSASLINGLDGDTQAAAAAADKAIIAMADNANKMGSSIDEVSHAYKNFAKNDYSMLDSLKLGFGGSATEAARLVNETGVMGDTFVATAENMNKVPYDKFLEAIQQVQDEMGITGTTAKEAASTVAGSKDTMEAAWTNFLTALGDSEADMEPFWNDLVASVETYASNLWPVVQAVAEKAMELAIDKMREHFPGFMEFVDTVIPPIKDAFNWIKDNAPMIAAAIAGVATALGIMKLQSMGIQGLKAAFMGLEVVQKLVTAAQWLMNAAMSANPIGILIAVIGGLVAAFVVLLTTNEDFRAKVIEIWGNIKEFFGNAVAAIGKFFTETLPNAIAQLPGKIATFLGNAITTVQEWAVNLGQKALEAGKAFLDNVVQFFKDLPYNIGFLLGYALAAIVTWGINIATKAKEAATNFVQNVVTFFQQLPERTATFLSNVIAKVKTWASDMANRATSAGRNFIDNVVDFVKQLPGKVWGFLTDVVSKVGSWAGDLASKGASAAKQLFDSVVNGIKGLPDRMLSIGSDLVRGLWDGINNMTDWVIGKIQSFGDGVLGGIKSFFGIESPSKVMRDQVGKMLAAGIAEGFGAEMPDTLRTMQKSMGNTVDALKGSVSVAANGVAGGYAASVGGGAVAAAASGGQTVIFNQYNNSPKALDRLSIYRDTNSLLFSAKVGLKNV